MTGDNRPPDQQRRHERQERERRMRDEERTLTAFCDYLRSEGWSVTREVEFCDAVATRAGTTLYVEAKGNTTAPGLDIDTMYGQLLRRMDPDDPVARYVAVVPDEPRAVRAVLRVHGRVRAQLRIDVYAVAADNSVRSLAKESA